MTHRDIKVDHNFLVIRYIRDRVSLRTWIMVGKVHQGQSAPEDSENWWWRVVDRYEGLVMCDGKTWKSMVQKWWCEV